MQKFRSFPFALTILFCLVLGSCTTYDLSPQDTAWNPYEEGERLTFISDEGEERTFTISKIEQTTNRVNVYAGNLSRLKESLTVFAIEEGKADEEFPILSVFKNSQDESFVNFNFALPEILEINHVEGIPNADTKLSSVNGYDGADFLSISPIQNVAPDVQIPYVTNFIFSKSEGFVQFSLTNNEVWRLNSL